MIQDQLQELTHLQQKIRIGRAVSSVLIQHVMNTVKTFQELLSRNKFDDYMKEHFCEQLAKVSQLAESLVSKFSMGELALGLERAFNPSPGPSFTQAHTHPQVTFQSGVLFCNHLLGAMTKLWRLSWPALGTGW